ncbi:hypothetical protein [Pseudomonas sp. Marseille-Q5115]|uniref:hypothetical protein n=1 Tax=Pseudomonas sp. Marseille-Q5115 TaxID=2866593 RepID=UPI001CE40FAF|nr:hypothetical protein [Pseudomonas sp. Marseille-Q5115]
MIDWSKAPEGATHWDPVDCNHLRQAGSTALMWSICTGWVEKGWQYPSDLSTMERLIARPAWDGQGLPPVGTVCEVRNAISGGWDSVDEVLSHTLIKGAPVAVCKRGDLVFYSHAEDFRPIRTPEQIEVEERERAVAEMLSVWKKTMGRFAEEEAGLAEMLYDAGYRKQEAGQ